MAAWAEGWADPHIVQITDTTWELRSASDYCLGIIELREGQYWALSPRGGASYLTNSLEATARSLFDLVVRGAARKPRALPPVGDPYWDDAPKSTSRYA